ncbi:hypothetical protein AX17_000097 [Amanita inopinata Kibby_2008]|nr:hypothetical protein AX17_000097 [Amanita inopinata Kibby_2008]
MAPKKSIFRQPGTKHFQLVHRSQRDPLIHDPDASQHVLKPYERENVKKGKTRAELESILSSEDVEHDKRAHVGEAALYGIYYDDTEYDYMQHLRQVGVQEDGVESVLIEATPNIMAKNKSGLDLPNSVFASKDELPRTYESQQAIPESIGGFQPDMDPHLRQVLEALEDDAFVDDELDDGFFGEIVEGGERGLDEQIGFDFREEGSDEKDGPMEYQNEEGPGEDAPWEERFAYYQKQRALEKQTEESDDGFASEEGDTVQGLPSMSVIGAKRRRRNGTSVASGYSMSSSSMHRNEALQTLDECFDQIMLKEYNDAEKILSDEDRDSDEAPELITSRGDFEVMMNEFMNDYEILGRKLQAKSRDDAGSDNPDLFRQPMGEVERRKVRESNGEEQDGFIPVEMENKRDRWDCETILSTFSNLENHPRLIRARNDKTTPKVYLDPKTGFPALAKPDTRIARVRNHVAMNDISGSDDDSDIRKVQHTITRPRNESREDKKSRKTAAKVEKQIRRAEKKTLKEQYEAETKAQKITLESRTKGRVRRLAQ